MVEDRKIRKHPFAESFRITRCKICFNVGRKGVQGMG